MPFDVNAAKEAGYTDSDIAGFLAQQTPNFDYQGAKKAGYNDSEIVSHLSLISPPKTFADKAISDIGNRGATALGNVIKNAKDGDTSLFSTGLQGLGAIGGSIMDVAADATPQSVKNAGTTAKQYIQSGAQNIANAIDSPTTEDMAVGAGDMASKAKSALSDIAQQHPVAARNIEAAGNATAGLPIAEGASSLVREAIPGITKTVMESSPSDFLKSTSSAAGEITPPASVKPSAASKYRGMVSLDENGNPIAGRSPRSYYPDLLGANNALSANTRASYSKAHDLGAVLSPETSATEAENIFNGVDNKMTGLGPENHKQTLDALNVFKKKSADGFNLADIDGTRKKLGRIAYDSNAGAEDKAAAKIAIHQIDGLLTKMEANPEMLDGGTPDAIAAIKQARKASALEQSHDMISSVIRKASGNPEALQSGFKSIYDDPDLFSGFSPEDQATIDYLAHPTKLNGLLKSFGKVGFGGKDITPALLESMGALYHPAAGVPVIGGTVANALRNKLTLKTADTMLRNMESRSVPASAIKTPFNDAEYEAALKRASETNSPKEPLALPAPDRPMVGGRGKQPRPATDEEWQNIIDAEKNAKETGFTSDVQKAQQTSRISKYEKENAANSAFNRLREVGEPISTSQTALHEPSTGLKKDIVFPEPEGGFKSGGAIKPTEAQKAAGNYKKPKVNLHGLNISIETPRGEIRSGKDMDGKEWKVTMPVSYGYILGTTGADKEHIDCFIGPNQKSLLVYVIDQKHHDSGKFDEHKVMLGFPDRESAIKAYRNSYSDKKNRIMKVTKLLIPEFKDWLKNGNTKKPITTA